MFAANSANLAVQYARSLATTLSLSYCHKALSFARMISFSSSNISFTLFLTISSTLFFRRLGRSKNEAGLI
ncbi:hypothetical protein RchiOBHm_Chr2g0120311 [Rosa chinensis]|uniref:Uncharacterized protein n=1 Tax=Rosa chinensis TaxID=74649 RepID=A0A2P6RS91_ROSCH|nr:hypothetical protein RchiOBHm_Chr2g0120311 [Rosa chinensis]